MWNPRPYDIRLPTQPAQPKYGVITTPSPNLGWLKEHRQQPNPRPLNLGTWTLQSKAADSTRVRGGDCTIAGLKVAERPPIVLDFEKHPATDPKGKAKESCRHIPGIAREDGDAAQREVQPVRR